MIQYCGFLKFILHIVYIFPRGNKHFEDNDIAVSV